MSETDVHFAVQERMGIIWVTLQKYNSIERAYGGLTEWRRYFSVLSNPVLRVAKVTTITEDCS